MQNLTPLACPNCGARLKVGAQARQFTCAFCGAQWSVERGRGAVSLVAAADRVASEATIPRLEKEIDDLILALLNESEARQSLRERIALPAPKLVLGEILQAAGVVFLMMAIVWAVALRALPTTAVDIVRLAPGALILVLLGLVVLGLGLLRSRAENEELRWFESHKGQLVTQLEHSLSRTRQLEAVLADKREDLERHKLLTSV